MLYVLSRWVIREERTVKVVSVCAFIIFIELFISHYNKNSTLVAFFRVTGQSQHELFMSTLRTMLVSYKLVCHWGHEAKMHENENNVVRLRTRTRPTKWGQEREWDLKICPRDHVGLENLTSLVFGNPAVVWRKRPIVYFTHLLRVEGFHDVRPTPNRPHWDLILGRHIPLTSVLSLHHCNLAHSLSPGFCLTGPFFQSYCQLGYSRLGWFTKVNSWVLLWPNFFYRADALPVAQPTASDHCVK